MKTPEENTPKSKVKIGNVELGSRAFQQAREIFSAIAKITVLRKSSTPFNYHFNIKSAGGCPYDISVSREKGTDKIVISIDNGEAIIKGAMSRVGPIVTDVIISDTSLSRGESLLSIPPVVSEELRYGDNIVEEIAQKLSMVMS